MKTNITLIIMSALSASAWSAQPATADTTVTSTTETTRYNTAPQTVLPFDARSIQIRRVVPDSSATDLTIYTTAEGRPDYVRRLTLMNEQISLGQSKGWLTDKTASELRQREQNLQTSARNIVRLCYPKRESSELEKQVTLLNMDISSNMSSNTDRTVAASKPLRIDSK